VLDNKNTEILPLPSLKMETNQNIQINMKTVTIFKDNITVWKYFSYILPKVKHTKLLQMEQLQEKKNIILHGRLAGPDCIWNKIRVHTTS
jgi:hypothetical protein